MKSNALTLRLLLLAASSLLTDCTTTAERSAAKSSAATASTVASGKKQAASRASQAPDAVDEYAVAEVSDPLEPLNRGMFWCNDQLYTFIFRPISKGYEIVMPKPVRKGVDNAFENVKFPVRFVNCALQGKFKRAGQETGKFFVNTIGGVAGIFKPAEKIQALANVPAEDTAQTFATWGIPHGPYIVLPLLGASSVRDTVGLAGDYALNPVNWPYLYWYSARSEHDWTIVPPSANSLRSMPAQFDTYDTATKEAVDPYLSVRSTYMQNRAEAARK
ncbi:VacJ family lipoprotein [Prosthecobacter sp.]|uniref:MlaA family lipoprotein n=1 Tax=Prosthecobacter sp. TaxID=1965333 RepID=UPI001DCB819E|nr:VacJ family lipoprotein [Prosthecobacter sp.]MCB1276623.1 VacJ family lipoprotein [Prosthecobacter sp.]